MRIKGAVHAEERWDARIQKRKGGENYGRQRIQTAQREARRTLEQARQQAEVQAREMMARAEEQAAELTRQQLRQAEQTCGEMKQQAQSRLKQAAAMIVEKVVND